VRKDRDIRNARNINKVIKTSSKDKQVPLSLADRVRERQVKARKEEEAKMGFGNIQTKGLSGLFSRGFGGGSIINKAPSVKAPNIPKAPSTNSVLPAPPKANAEVVPKSTVIPPKSTVAPKASPPTNSSGQKPPPTNESRPKDNHSDVRVVKPDHDKKTDKKTLELEPETKPAVSSSSSMKKPEAAEQPSKSKAEETEPPMKFDADLEALWPRLDPKEFFRRSKKNRKDEKKRDDKRKDEKKDDSKKKKNDMTDDKDGENDKKTDDTT